MDSYSVKDGWITGKLPGPQGTLVPVEREPRGPYDPLKSQPQLVLHTTETDIIASWDYPPQFTVGEGIVVQHKPLWAKGEALRGDESNDPYAMQIEIVGYSKLAKWLPGPSSLRPLAALTAVLHDRRVIRTGLARPADWPVVLDRGPQATSAYYRRKAGLWWHTDGVYGHVEIPDNTHWDPGSFDYPAFFEMVSALIPKKVKRYVVKGEQYKRWRYAQRAARKVLTEPGDEVTIRLRDVLA